jgi:murein DD-endopeptidase MepM/ murein hydrolase activator NlpD
VGNFQSISTSRSGNAPDFDRAANQSGRAGKPALSGDEFVLTNTNNAVSAKAFLNLFRPRDIFLHDGASLRRVRIGTGVQFFAAFAAALTLFWSVFAAAQLASVQTASTSNNPAEIARMAREVQAMQADVAVIKAAAQQRFQFTAAEVRRLGLNPSRIQVQGGVGGPYEAVDPARAADPSFKAMFNSWKQLDQLEQGTIAIPSAEPVKGVAFTSSYGVRSDPFRGTRAMHAGIDLAGPIGTPIYATADGIVGRSEYNSGGYGNLVEINHGRGIQTRYGHLSRSLVSAGQHVKRGDMIAMMGSTGRSTGSHLHYEVRIDGKAVNPVPFLQSSNYLQSVQRRAAATAVGGPAVGTR